MRYTIAAVVALAFAVRAPLALVAPVVSPDGAASQIVAANILLHGCISLSDPAAGACVPHWGGNHPPGYPGFLALSWTLFGQGLTSPLLVQSAIFAMAAGWLVRATAIFSRSRLVGSAVGLVAALSPVQLAWARFVLPETLSLAAALWVLAELMLSLHQRRLRWAPLGLGLLAASFLRYDGILLCVPVAVCGFMVHRPLQASARGVPIILILAVPFAAWAIHNTSRGLALLPEPFSANLTETPAPLGITVGRWR